MEIKMHFLVLSFTFIFLLLHPSSAICVKRNATMFQFSAPLTQPSKPSAQPPTTHSSSPSPTEPDQSTTPAPAPPVVQSPKIQQTTKSSPASPPPVQAVDSPDQPAKEDKVGESPPDHQPAKHDKGGESPPDHQPAKQGKGGDSPNQEQQLTIEAPDQSFKQVMEAPDQSPLEAMAMEAPDQAPLQPMKMPAQPVQMTVGSPAKPGKAAKHASPEIEKMCQKTDYAELCVTLIPSSTKPDPATVLGVLIARGKEDTDAALAAAKKFGEKAGAQKEMVGSTVDVCEESYGDAIDNFNKAMSAMQGRDIATMNTMLSAAMTNYDTCETGFAEMPGMNSPLTAYDEKLSKLSSICLAIATLIK